MQLIKTIGSPPQTLLSPFPCPAATSLGLFRPAAAAHYRRASAPGRCRTLAYLARQLCVALLCAAPRPRRCALPLAAVARRMLRGPASTPSPVLPPAARRPAWLCAQAALPMRNPHRRQHQRSLRGHALRSRKCASAAWCYHTVAKMRRACTPTPHPSVKI